MKLYRLTTANQTSKHGKLWWAVGVTHTIPEEERGTVLCQPGLLHAYRSIAQALLQDPTDAGYGDTARIWEIEGDIAVEGPLKVGCYTQTITAEAAKPAWWLDENLRQRVILRYGLLCAASVQPQPTPPYWPPILSATEAIISSLRDEKTQIIAGFAANAAGAAAASAAAAVEASYAAACAVATAVTPAAYAAAETGQPIDFVALAAEAVRIEENYGCSDPCDT